MIQPVKGDSIGCQFELMLIPDGVTAKTGSMVGGREDGMLYLSI